MPNLIPPNLADHYSDLCTRKSTAEATSQPAPVAFPEWVKYLLLSEVAFSCARRPEAEGTRSCAESASRLRARSGADEASAGEVSRETPRALLARSGGGPLLAGHCRGDRSARDSRPGNPERRLAVGCRPYTLII